MDPGKNLSGMMLGTLVSAIGTSSAIAVPVPGGTLDPLTIPKYVTPLVIPEVLYSDKGGTRPLNVEVALWPIKQQVLPAGFPKTPLWAYGDPKEDDSFNNPAATIEVTKDVTSTIKWSNQLVRDPEDCFDRDDDDDYEGRDGERVGKRESNRDCQFVPHIIQDAAGKPLIDQTLHWAAPNDNCANGAPGETDCRGNSADPYFGPIPMVTHVHGAHVGPGSDGYPEAWWLPNASNIDCTNVPGYPATPNPNDDYACNGTFFESAEGADTLSALGQGYAIDTYPNDQPTTTLWYHDHTLGITRLNVYAAGAGFWLIRDPSAVDAGCAGGGATPNLACSPETGLVKGTLPAPAPALGQDPNCSARPGPGPGGDGHHRDGHHGDGGSDGRCVRDQIREIPIAIQPKSFNADGTQYFPADRAFFEGLGDGQSYALNPDMTSLVTDDGLFPFLPQAISDIAPVWNPEAFFNTMVVNGNTWPQLDVAAERYRFRLLNAADSRFLNMALFVVNPDGSLGQEIPFYQIGAEQSLLPAVVRIRTGEAVALPGDGTEPIPAPDTAVPTALLIGPAERADVIVDFSDLLDGTVVRMINTAPDAPFGGFPDVPADPATTGQVMQFVVNAALANPAGDPSTPPADLVLDKDPGGVPKLGEPDAIQDLALLEEESLLICVVVDAVSGAITQVAGTPPNCPVVNGVESMPFGPKAAVLGVNGSEKLGPAEVQLWDDPIAQNPALGAIETWELWNRSADAHPIHLHLVKFEVLDRAPVGNPIDGRRPAEPWEAGWKDTVIALPDEVTRVKALFDIPGLYVWHCHILSHEDNEMMVPYCVGTPGVDCPAELFLPAAP